MVKPIIATSLVGIFLSKEPWERAHLMWFEDAANKLDRIDIKDWGLIYTQKTDYFNKIYEIMDLMHPTLSLQDKTLKAREMFFNYVIKYIKINQDIVKHDVAKYFRSLKDRYKIALVSSQTRKFIDEILLLTDLNDIFDIIECAEPSEQDDRQVVYERFENKHGKPLVYFSKEETLDEIKYKIENL